MKPHGDVRVKSFPNIFKRFCFFDSGPDCPPTESVRDGTMTLAYPPSHVRKSEGLAKAQRTPRTPLVFLAFPAPWRDTIFPALNDPHLLSESELIVWKARTHFLQEIFCSASNRVARRGDTKAQFANQTGSRGSSSSTRRTYTSPEAAPGASLRLIDCLILDTAVLLIYE